MTKPRNSPRLTGQGRKTGGSSSSRARQRTKTRPPGRTMAAMAAVGAAGERLHEVISADCPDLIYTCEEIELLRKVFIHR